jgi:WhiB family transcriptional regulator, redox-sensing transcriptional regulator
MSAILAGSQGHAVAKADTLAQLLSHLLPDEFGHGAPACADEDPELFWPLTELATRQIERAKAVCRACPIQASCLRWALRHGEQGIWGGTTEEERARLRRQRHADPAGQDQAPAAGEAVA